MNDKNFAEQMIPHFKMFDEYIARDFPGAECLGVGLIYKVPQEDGTCKSVCLTLGQGVPDWDNWVGPTQFYYPYKGQPGYYERGSGAY